MAKSFNTLLLAHRAVMFVATVIVSQAVRPEGCARTIVPNAGSPAVVAHAILSYRACGDDVRPSSRLTTIYVALRVELGANCRRWRWRELAVVRAALQRDALAPGRHHVVTASARTL